MISHRLGLLNKNQRGFTLVEVIIVLAIIGIVIGAATMTIVQVINGSSSTSNHMIAIRQVQNAGYWVSRDVQMAQEVEPTADPDGFPLTLRWTEWADGGLNGDQHQVVYTLLVDNKLQREHYTNLNLDATTIVAEFIDPDETNCYLNEHFGEELQYENGALTFTVTAKVSSFPQEQSETRIYHVMPRPGSQ